MTDLNSRSTEKYIGGVRPNLGDNQAVAISVLPWTSSSVLCGCV